jgi:hypothetical protein
MKLRTKLWVLFAVLGLLLAACGGGDGGGATTTGEADGGTDTTAAPNTTDTPDTTEAPMEDVTLTLLTDDNEQNSEYADALIAAYMEAHPNVTIEHELRPGGGEGDNIVKTRLATGEPLVPTGSPPTSTPGFKTSATTAARSKPASGSVCSPRDWAKIFICIGRRLSRRRSICRRRW